MSTCYSGKAEGGFENHWVLKAIFGKGLVFNKNPVYDGNSLSYINKGFSYSSFEVTMNEIISLDTLIAF